MDFNLFKTSTQSVKNMLKKEKKSFAMEILDNNITHLTVKRDLTLHISVFLIQNALLSKPTEHRRKVYANLKKLLTIALEANDRIKASKKVNQKQIKIFSDYIQSIKHLIDVSSHLLETNQLIFNSLEKATEHNLNEPMLQCGESEKNIFDTMITVTYAFENITDTLSNPFQNLKKRFNVDIKKYQDIYNNLKDNFMYKYAMYESLTDENNT